MQHGMFIVKTSTKYYGPFQDYETSSFVSSLEGEAEIIPLLLPSVPASEPQRAVVLEQDGYQAYVDGFKIDTVHMLGGITQNFDLAHRDQRVLTKRELDTLWREVFDICRAVESLMHYADKVISDPTPGNLVALRKALWRNRNSDDVDPHYEDRFW